MSQVFKASQAVSPSVWVAPSVRNRQMFKFKTVSATVAVLGGVVLLGLGCGQAVATETPATCSDDGQGSIRCVDTSERELTSRTYGKVHIVNDVRQSCSGKDADVSCQTSLTVDGQQV
ncbi:hypothetical protein [Streptomyces sp. XHT-2]|uniref:hypothetical protein n=1 Tax=Streptomyces sp. XHT-2 TaxID=2692621 RepID=UPI001F1D34AD|nr:hypothetical protein OG880_11490 [Streptomyces cellulosae]WTB69414.1 hypothetical protein OIE90_11500 [Streptomyces cellulosae]